MRFNLYFLLIFGNLIFVIFGTELFHFGADQMGSFDATIYPSFLDLPSLGIEDNIIDASIGNWFYYILTGFFEKYFYFQLLKFLNLSFLKKKKMALFIQKA